MFSIASAEEIKLFPSNQDESVDMERLAVLEPPERKLPAAGSEC